MKVFKYRLTWIGKLGAVLFVAPTPIAAFYAMPPKLSVGEEGYRQALREATGRLEAFEPSSALLIALATASLIGLVMLFIGREIITTEG